MIIENWAVITPTPDRYAAPETLTQCLHGEVFDHPRFEDGHRVTTSSIRGKTETGEVVTHSGSIYDLGQIDEAYEVAFPGARKRLLDSLTIINNPKEPHVCPCCECKVCECL
jgi:hypothetical protein